MAFNKVWLCELLIVLNVRKLWLISADDMQWQAQGNDGQYVPEVSMDFH